METHATLSQDATRLGSYMHFMMYLRLTSAKIDTKNLYHANET